MVEYDIKLKCNVWYFINQIEVYAVELQYNTMLEFQKSIHSLLSIVHWNSQYLEDGSNSIRFIYTFPKLISTMKTHNDSNTRIYRHLRHGYHILKYICNHPVRRYFFVCSHTQTHKSEVGFWSDLPTILIFIEWNLSITMTICNKKKRGARRYCNK